MAKVTGSDQSEPGSALKRAVPADSYINVSASGEYQPDCQGYGVQGKPPDICAPQSSCCFGEDMARQGIRDGMDCQGPEARATVYVLVAKEGVDILEADTVLKMPSSDLKDNNEQDITSTVPQTTLYDIMNDILSRSKRRSFL